MVFAWFLAAQILAAGVSAQGLPDAKGPVNDMAGVIAPADREAMENLGNEIWRKTEAEMALVTMPRLPARGAAAYARLLMDHWHLNKPEVDKGVLILADAAGGQVHIEAGPGLDDLIDRRALNHIVAGEMRPYMTRGSISWGLRIGFERIAERIYPHFRASQAPPPVKSSGGLASIGASEWALLAFIFGLLILGVVILMPSSTEPPSPRSGGGFGRGSGLGKGGGPIIRIVYGWSP